MGQGIKTTVVFMLLFAIILFSVNAGWDEVGLISLYTFQVDCTDDYLGNWNGTLTNVGIISTNCTIGNCAVFSGNGNCQLPTNMFQGWDKGTVCMWVKQTSPQKARDAFWSKMDVTTWYMPRLQVRNTGTMNFNWAKEGLGGTGYQHSYAFPNQYERYFVCVNWNASGSALFVNGTLVDYVAVDNPPHLRSQNKFHIGYEEFSNVWMQGTIDEVTFYNISKSTADLEKGYNNGSGKSPIAVADTTPPDIEKVEDVSGSLTNKTDDTTPTINCTTDINSDCDLSNDNATWVAFSTTGGTEHVGTLPTAQAFSIGEGKVIYLNCTNIANSSASSYEDITYNITDGTPPTVNLITPLTGYYWVGGNTTDAMFQFNYSENHDLQLNCTAYEDSTIIYSNTSTDNGTTITFTRDLSFGSYTWNVTCIDNHSNQGSSASEYDVFFQPNITLSLDGVVSDRKYELGSIINISANCTSLTGECEVCINITAPNTPETCGTNRTHYIYNITTLRNSATTNGATETLSANTAGITVPIDNKTELIQTRFNLSGAGTSSNMNISYGGIHKNYTGDLIGVYVKNKEFIYSGNSYEAINLTYSTAGSNYISLTVPDNPILLSFDISGFDIDSDNVFSYTEDFNDNSKINQSDGLDDVDSFKGTLDSFITNLSNWMREEASGCTLTISGGKMTASCSPNQNQKVRYENLAGDMRNSSYIEILYDYTFSGAGQPGGTGGYFIQAYDGSSSVTLYSDSQYIYNPATHKNTYNISVKKNSEDYTSWKVYRNGTFISTKDISFLNFDNPIEISLYVESGNTISTTMNMYYYKWSGAWLNYSNGYYNIKGNVTSTPVNISPTNISRATLTCKDYTPTGTNITYYLSNGCGWEKVQSGLLHVFTSTCTNGNSPMWKAELNGDNETTPIVRHCEVEVVRGSVENVSIEEDGLGENKWTYNNILNSTNSPQTVELNTTTGTRIIKISTSTPGQIQVNNMNMNSSINPVTLNYTYLEDETDIDVNFSFSGNDINISGIEFDFYGSKNYTATSSSGVDADSNKIQIYYSAFNFTHPTGYEWYDVLPNSKDAKNVTPYDQDSNTPIRNFTNLAYDEPIDLYIRFENESNSCITMSTNNLTYRYNISGNPLNITNKTYQRMFNNIPIDSDLGRSRWDWWDFNNCSRRLYLPYLEYTAVCSECVLDVNDFPNYNIMSD